MSGAAAGRSRSSSRKQARELEAIERHTGVAITPWSPGANTAPAPVEPRRPPRTPSRSAEPNGDERYARLIADAGRADGVEVRDLVDAVTHKAGLDGEAVRDVKVLERFSLLSVPEAEAERVVEAVSGAQLAGREIRLQRAG